MFNMQRRFLSLPKSISSEFRRYLFSASAGNLVIPFYALFVPLLASRLGASLFEIGLVGGASNAVYSFLPLILGHFSRRAQLRRFFIAASFVVLVGVSISYVLISNPVYLIFARIFEGVGWAMLWPAMDIAVSKDVAPSADSKKTFSIYNVSWSGAAATGPLLGSALIFLSSIRIAFLCTVFIIGAALVLNLVPFLRQRGQNLETSDYAIGPVSGSPLDAKQGTRLGPTLGMGFYCGSLALVAVSSGVLFTFFAPYAKSVGIPILLVGVITFVFGLGRFSFYVLTINERIRHAVLRSDKRARNMLIGLSLTSLSSLLVSLRDPSGLVYLAAYAMVGVGIAIVLAIAQTGLIVESAPGKFGLGAGLFESSIGAGACAGPIIGGAISGSSLAVPFIVPPLGFLVFIIAYPLLLRKTR